MTAVHSRILDWHTVATAAVAAAAGMAVGCSGHLMVVVLKRGVWHMAQEEEQNLLCMGRVLHDAERDGGGGAAADGCSGSS